LEWDWLVQTWFTIKWENCTVNVWYGCFWSWDASLANFQSDLKLPRAGWIQRENASIGTQEYYGNYWSSSPNDTLHATPNTFGARNLFIYDVFIAPQGSTFRAYGLSVRCFKN
jgi:hypothetical protein